MPFTVQMFTEIVAYIAWIAAAFAVLFNGKLAYLVRTASPDGFGSYTSLMYANACNLIAFSLLHAFTQPTISIEKSVVYVFAARNYLKWPKIGMRLLLALYGVSYCMSLVLCAVTFYYRYNRICRKNHDKFTGRSRIAFWYTLVATIGLYWGFCIFFLAAETSAVDDIIRAPLAATYGCDLANVTYVAANYVQTDTSTGVTMNVRSVLMGVSFLTIIGTSMSVVGWCVWQIARTTKTFKDNMYFKEIERQLFHAQCVQMAIPFMLVFIPVAAVLLLPLFDLNCHVIFSVVSILVLLYPCIDPITVMLFVSHYREKIFGKRKSDEHSGNP